MAKPILIFAGPSGGHLFPALAFAESLRLKDPAIPLYLVTSIKGKRFEPSLTAGGSFEKIIYLSDFPSTSLISLNGLRFLLKLPGAFKEALDVLSEIKPGLSVGFGSYVSFPGVLCSSWKRIPTVIHEQNFDLGKATQWLLPHVDCAATSFPELPAKHRARHHEFTGIPLRRKLINAAQTPPAGPSARDGFPAGSFRILIAGGSQGSRRLNALLLDAFSCFSPEEKSEIAVIHITGKEDSERMTTAYREMGLGAVVYPFFDRMEDLYRAADIAVTRAGASTLFELALFRLPAVVVPYPFAGEHQKANAGYFESRGAVVCRTEKQLTGYTLYKDLMSLKSDGSARSRMRESLDRLRVPDAAERLVRVALDFSGRRTS